MSFESVKFTGQKGRYVVIIDIILNSTSPTAMDDEEYNRIIRVSQTTPQPSQSERIETKRYKSMYRVALVSAILTAIALAIQLLRDK